MFTPLSPILNTVTQRDIEDFVFDCVAWWHPRTGPLTADSILTRAQHNGYPNLTRPELITVLDTMAARGTILKGWY